MMSCFDFARPQVHISHAPGVSGKPVSVQSGSWSLLKVLRSTSIGGLTFGRVSPQFFFRGRLPHATTGRLQPSLESVISIAPWGIYDTFWQDSFWRSG